MLGIETESSVKLDELWQIDEIYVQHTITDEVINMATGQEGCHRRGGQTAREADRAV